MEMCRDGEVIDSGVWRSCREAWKNHWCIVCRDGEVIDSGARRSCREAWQKRIELIWRPKSRKIARSGCLVAVCGSEGSGGGWG
ncbi:hypothetical protein OWV82_012537 [Melia azedarach]|uniref:Uncharacterized protein n=1 Tax=Melia azedarach TaxID=155640 RepID=A0ACC1XSU0_MELAZ|nr:hypothetical protein OWV82_012537 [Melia azedarach]